jgi:hypothetical protein
LEIVVIVFVVFTAVFRILRTMIVGCWVSRTIHQIPQVLSTVAILILATLVIFVIVTAVTAVILRILLLLIGRQRDGRSRAEPAVRIKWLLPIQPRAEEVQLVGLRNPRGKASTHGLRQDVPQKPVEIGLRVEPIPRLRHLQAFVQVILLKLQKLIIVLEDLLGRLVVFLFLLLDEVQQRGSHVADEVGRVLEIVKLFLKIVTLLLHGNPAVIRRIPVLLHVADDLE